MQKAVTDWSAPCVRILWCLGIFGQHSGYAATPVGAASISQGSCRGVCSTRLFAAGTASIIAATVLAAVADGTSRCWLQVMTSLHGKTKADSLPDSPDLPGSPCFQSHAQQTQTPATGAKHVQEDQACIEADMSDVAVHKFPVEKQLLLQMRFKQMHGRKPADLITTPAKPLPVRSIGAGMVSPSHVGFAQPSMTHTHDHSSQLEMQLAAPTIYASPPAINTMPHRQQDPPDIARLLPSDMPPFEDLRHCEDAAAMQEAEAGMRMVQHAMTDPGINAQWPVPAEAVMPAQHRRSIPLQHLHEEQQVHPSYAWSTQQLTAIAASAATAAAAAFQQEIYAKQTALAAPVDITRSAEQTKMHICSLDKPKLRPGMPAAAAAPAAAAQDAQTMTETAVLRFSQDSEQTGCSSQLPVLLASVQQDQQLRQPQQPKKQQAVPKQAAALHKLKHRNSASRGLTGQTVLVTHAKAAPVKSPTESADHPEADKRNAARDHHGVQPQMQQVRPSGSGSQYVVNTFLQEHMVPQEP